MTDYQRTIEFLRDFRAAPGQRITDDVRRCASEYADLCAKANDRLRQCSLFLQQGLRRGDSPGGRISQPAGIGRRAGPA